MTPVQSEAEMPPVFAPVLQRLREDRAAFPPSVRLTPVAYQARPFSNVMRLRMASAGSPAAGYCFAKIQTPKPIPDAEEHMRRRVLHEFEITSKVEQALAAHPGMDALHPITCYPELFTIVTREIEGVTLLRYLEDRLTWLAGPQALSEAKEAVCKAGQWLRLFQTIQPTDDVVAMADLKHYVELRLARLVSSGQSPITALMRERVLTHLEALGAAVPAISWRSVMLHADLAPANIMVTGQGIAVLDFAMASRGTYLHDISRLALQIDLLRGKPQFRTGAVRQVIDALLNGFAPEVTLHHPLYRLLTLRHRVNHLATLTLTRATGPARMYNWRLRRMHERDIAGELASPVVRDAPGGVAPAER